ncbi:MAG: hypothetical protein JW809_02280 [Pirellulales bacterium]|nr:hypothetical protein [Pirellulales bacterium]
MLGFFAMPGFFELLILAALVGVPVLVIVLVVVLAKSGRAGGAQRLCPHCRGPVTPRDLTCPHCGQPLSK